MNTRSEKVEACAVLECGWRRIAETGKPCPDHPNGGWADEAERKRADAEAMVSNMRAMGAPARDVMRELFWTGRFRYLNDDALKVLEAEADAEVES